MSYVKKLVIGTANFGQEYDGYWVPKEEIEKIWECCIDAGIDYADCASAYKYTPPDWVKCINKITDASDQISPYATLIHHIEDVPKLWPALWQYKLMSSSRGYPFKIGISIYPEAVVSCLPFDIVQLPYTEHKRFEELKLRGIEIHVRNVFKDNCFEDAIKNPLVDHVVIGVDSVKQLKENIELCKKWEKK